MRVLMLAPEPFFEPRGTCYSVLYRIEALTALGHQVDLVTYHLGETPAIPGLRVHRIPRVPGVRSVKIGPSWPKVILDALLFVVALRLLLRGRYDVIHSHEEASFMAVPLRAVFRTRHVYDMHSSLPQQLRNFDFMALRPVIGLFAALERWALRRSDAVITICADLRDHVEAVMPGANQALIENLGDAAPWRQAAGPEGAGSGVTPDGLRERYRLAGRRVVLYTGTFERYQGLDLLVDAAPQVAARHPDALFLLVGGTREQVAALRERAAQRGIADRVVFTGTVPQADIPRYLAVADVLVSPRTLGTNTPLKIYAYLRSGKPIVATDLWTHTQVLTPEVAVLTPPTVEGIAAGVERVLGDPALAACLGEAGRRLADERYSYAHYLRETKRLYDSLAPAPPEPAFAD